MPLVHGILGQPSYILSWTNTPTSFNYSSDEHVTTGDRNILEYNYPKTLILKRPEIHEIPIFQMMIHFHYEISER